MARQVLVLALILFFIVGMASAAAAKPDDHDIGEIADGPSDDVAEGPIGPTDDDNDDAAPVGGPVPAGAFPTSSSTDPQSASTPGSSSASALEFSTIAGIAAAAGAAFFF